MNKMKDLSTKKMTYIWKTHSLLPTCQK
jgi:hypothetical protein